MSRYLASRGYSFEVHFQLIPRKCCLGSQGSEQGISQHRIWLSVNFYNRPGHRSSSDTLAVSHSSCLFGAESYSGQRERKSVWEGFLWSLRFVNSCLANSPSVYIYTVIRTLQLLLRLTSVVKILVHNFPWNNLLHRMSLITRNAKVSKYDCTINVTKST